MHSINVHLSFPSQVSYFQKIDSLAREGNLIYCDGGDDFKAHLKTVMKFAILTGASPLIAIARLARSAAFPFMTGDIDRSAREFVGSLATPFVAGFCLTGSLLSSVIYAISAGNLSFYVGMRRTYAYFEAWMNRIDLNDPSLTTYSHRVSAPTDFIGTSSFPHDHVWTTAPCMQPLLERGNSHYGGLLDIERIKKIYPLIPIKGIYMENGKLVIRSHYKDKFIHYSACNGACKHERVTSSCCCCYRVEAAYDRILCCELSQGKCSSMADPNESCGFVGCCVCGSLGACCCYAHDNNETILLSTGCFGLQGPSCITAWD